MTSELRQKFQAEGYVIVRNFLPADSAARLKQISVNDSTIAEHAFERMDASGRASKVTLWYEPGDDVFGRLSRSDRLLAEMSDVLAGPADFFHAKLMQKEPKSGGAWEWHQDYGYWYDDGFLTDDMASCYVALDAATSENGCLMVIPGSHVYGRLNHGSVGEQVGADMGRVEVLRERHGTVHVELDPGDAVYFHSNLLHASNPNLSDRSRWGLISSFFRNDNQSVLNDPRLQRKLIKPVPHDEVLSAFTSSDTNKAFLKPHQ